VGGAADKKAFTVHDLMKTNHSMKNRTSIGLDVIFSLKRMFHNWLKASCLKRSVAKPVHKEDNI
jgi:hypothetical protein